MANHPGEMGSLCLVGVSELVVLNWKKKKNLCLLFSVLSTKTYKCFNLDNLSTNSTSVEQRKFQFEDPGLVKRWRF